MKHSRTITKPYRNHNCFEDRQKKHKNNHKKTITKPYQNHKKKKYIISLGTCKQLNIDIIYICVYIYIYVYCDSTSLHSPSTTMNRKPRGCQSIISCCSTGGSGGPTRDRGGWVFHSVLGSHCFVSEAAHLTLLAWGHPFVPGVC